MKTEKQIDCKSVKERILLGEKLNADEELHLLECRECQDFSLAQQLLLNPQLSPSAELDGRVLASVKALRRQQPIRMHGWAWRPIAAAASIVLVCCLAFVLAGRRAGQAPLEDSLQATLPSMTLEYALADNELDRLEIALDALNLGVESSKAAAESGVEGVRRLDYDIISLEMDMFFDL